MLEYLMFGLVLAAFAACAWVEMLFCKARGITVKEDIKNGWNAFCSACREGVTIIRGWLSVAYADFCEWLELYRRCRRPRHEWGYDLECDFRAVLKDYAYNAFDPFIMPVYTAIPSVIRIQFITKTAIAEETAVEVMEHLVSKFKHNCTSCGLTYPFFPYYFKDGTFVRIYILYCEYEQELPDFYKVINQIVMSRTDGNFGTLKECNVPKYKGDELILGYSATKWDNGGVVSPFVWSCKKDPNLIIAGVVGGGKSVCAQLLVRQLLSQKKDLYILDFKGGGDDWVGIFKSDRYAEYLDCYSMFDRLYQEYLETIEKKEYRERYILIDEFNSMSLNLEGKEQKIFFKKLGHLIYTARSWGVKVILVGQSFSHEALPVSIRSQCNTRLYLANRMSAQESMMLFPGLSDEIDLGQRLNNYNGYITAPSVNIDKIVIPELENPKQLKLDLEMLGKQYYE